MKLAKIIDNTRCIGCHACTTACKSENEVPIGVDRTRVKYVETGVFPNVRRHFQVTRCNQCEHPPCVDVCPVEATWKEKDGIVVVDYNWCIGCRYCEAACPYHARRFNWQKPQIPAPEINPDQSYLSNRIRPQGVMEKCTFCLHRTRNGRLPACLEACPTGARVFGDLNDPASEVRYVLENKRVFVLKEELGLKPQFFYFFDE